MSTRLDTSSIAMPSETAFKQHADSVRSALKTFTTISQLDAPGPVKTAFDELVNVTADFNKFMPTFTSHLLFQEIPPLVHNALEEFLSKHSAFDKPANYSKVAGLNARALDSLHISARRGTFSTVFHLSLLIHLFLLSAAISAANLRPEKKSKAKATAPVSPRIFLSYFFMVLIFIFQGKRSRISKETVDSDDDIAEFLESSASSACKDCGPAHPLSTCPKDTVPVDAHREPPATTVIHLLLPHVLSLIQVYRELPLLRAVLKFLWMSTMVRSSYPLFTRFGLSGGRFRPSCFRQNSYSSGTSSSLCASTKNGH